MARKRTQEAREITLVAKASHWLADALLHSVRMETELATIDPQPRREEIRSRSFHRLLDARQRLALALEAYGVGPGPDRLEVDVALAPGGRVTGRLCDTTTGEGVPGRVRALAAREQRLGGTDHDAWITINEWSTATTADGRFELTGLPPGELTLEVEGVGARPTTLRTTLEPRGTAELEVQVEPR